MKVGLVTCEKVDGLTASEQPLVPLFKDKGVVAEAVIWNDTTVDWKAYDFLIVRSIWDYHLDPAAFSEWMHAIDHLGVKTLNPTTLIRANQHKFYLRRLQENGIAIVPTLFIDKTTALDLSMVKQVGWQQAVIKPAISASSFLTEAFAVDDLQRIENEYRPIARSRDLLVQKFMPEVREFGELSLLFFDRKYSHTVLKTATTGEFRVQSEFGGTTKRYRPDRAIVKAAADILSLFEGTILYARIDGLILEGKFVLMEIELIEPDLFFDYDKEAIQKFVTAATTTMTSVRA